MKDKIRKLLALAADPGASPQEAETASRQAAALMAKHDIDLADLEEEALKAEFDLTEAQAMGCRPGKTNAVEVPPWIGIIAYGVKVYTRTRVRAGRGVVFFRGPREDVELAQWLTNTLVTGAYAASKGSPQPHAFRNGYAAAIQRRLKDLARDRDQADTSEGQRLVLFQGTRERIMTEAYGPDQGARSSSVRQSEAGRQAGQSAHIPTGRPISHSHLRLR